jgi:hypothetical protein
MARWYNDKGVPGILKTVDATATPSNADDPFEIYMNEYLNSTVIVW